MRVHGLSTTPLILDPRDPIPSAIEFLRRTPECWRMVYNHHVKQFHLYRHGKQDASRIGSRVREPYAYVDVQPCPTDTVRARIWLFLDKAQKVDRKGAAVRFSPRLKEVNAVLAALKVVCADRHAWGLSSVASEQIVEEGCAMWGIKPLKQVLREFRAMPAPSVAASAARRCCHERDFNSARIADRCT